MKSFWNKLHRLGDILHLPDMPNWLVGVLALVLILRIPSFFEPYYYGDEMIYMTLGTGVRQGLTLYKDLHDNKPPLLYLTAALAGNLFWFKAILAFWSLITIVLFWKLAGRIFQNQFKTQKIATILFAVFTTIPLLEGNTVNAELFMIGPVILAFIILFRSKTNFKNIYWAGFLFGIAALFKIPAMFDMPVIVFYWIFTTNFNSGWKEIIKKTFILALGFATPILFTFAWYATREALPEYIKAAFLQNVGYVSSFRPDDVQKSFLAKNAPLLIRGIVVLIGLAITFLMRKKVSNRFVFLCIWILFTLFAITLSERPYPHYLIQAVAPVAFLFATFFADKSIEQVLVVIPLTLAFFVPVYYKFSFYNTVGYYQRFIDFATKKTSKETYFSDFSKNANRNYEIADFLLRSSRQDDRVFMWDPDSATVYSLSRRLPPIKFTVPYHIHDYSSNKELASLLKANPPKFIILTSGNPLPEIGDILTNQYLLINQIGNANIYARTNLVQDK